MELITQMDAPASRYCSTIMFTFPMMSNPSLAIRQQSMMRGMARKTFDHPIIRCNVNFPSTTMSKLANTASSGLMLHNNSNDNSRVCFSFHPREYYIRRLSHKRPQLFNHGGECSHRSPGIGSNASFTFYMNF